MPRVAPPHNTIPLSPSAGRLTATGRGFFFTTERLQEPIVLKDPINIKM